MQLSEPSARVYARVNALRLRILWVSLSLGLLTAAAGAWGTRRLTRRLRRLTESAMQIGSDPQARLTVPPGEDEVSRLATAFAKVLEDLKLQRLAEENRRAAVLRERLKIARDLHDTLAHSMMAMLSEVRLLRRIHVHDPAALGPELVRAEQVAQDGLNEARLAITQMRPDGVRDTGLGAALERLVARFRDRTGSYGRCLIDPAAAEPGDQRAETLYRIAEEALRNVERHAQAGEVTVTLRRTDDAHIELEIRDDGVGFDPQIPRPGHFGLVGLREQAQLVGAELELTSVYNQRTTVRARVPVMNL